VRVGIASGLVVMGGAGPDGAVHEPIAIGEAPDLAARLQSAAPPDKVVIAASTRDLVRGLFDYHEVGEVALEGLAESVPAWQVAGTSGAASRFEALRGGGSTPLVGRDEEIDLLLRRWQQIQTGDEGRVVLISGEPGIGKSRLVRALQERLANEALVSFYCSPNHQDSPLYPVITQLESAAGFRRDDSAEERFAKFEKLIRPPIDDEARGLMAALLSVPAGDRYPSFDLSPQRHKQRTLEALAAQLTGLASEAPILMVFEDAHWIDPTSGELLGAIVDQARNLPMLVLITCRPEFTPPWPHDAHVTTVALNRLSNREVTAMADHLTGKRLPSEVYRRIIDHSDGVPLFIEELVKAVLQSELLVELDDEYLLHGSLSPLMIPGTLQALLIARLDRLGTAKEVAQIGAALGREFSYETIAAVADWLPEKQLQTALHSLVQSELVYCRGRPPDALYLFKHALLQDAAQETLVRSRRRKLHARIAAMLQERFPEVADQQPALLAHHYTEGGSIEQAVAFWSRAGRRSAARSAMTEAAAQLRKGLDQLALLPKDPRRQRQELELLSSLSVILRSVKGIGAAETGEVYARARDLWEQLGCPPEFVQIPYGQSRYHAYRGEFDRAQSLAEDLLRLSLQRNDPAGLFLAHYSSGITQMYTGRFTLSRSHLEQTLALYCPASHRSFAHQFGIHPPVGSEMFLGMVLSCLGFPEQALARSNAAIAEARRLAHPPTLASCLISTIVTLWFVGDIAAMGERAEELIAVTTEHRFAMWRAQGIMCRGLVEVENGNVTEGMSAMRDGLTASRDTGVPGPQEFIVLAAAWEMAGQVEEALTLLDQALQIGERTGNRWLEAELTRRKGRLLWRRGDGEAAEKLYRKALSIAEEQEAKLWELRAATSLARLWGDRGERTEARARLAPIYNWFTEGFGTADLKEAKALLDNLSA
jgi:tetratricopeptide (TPR) repeat protein